MADLPDIRRPIPDLGHEALRQAVVSALDDIKATVEQLGHTNADVEMTLGLTDTAFMLVDSALAGLQEAGTARGGLAARVTQLEQQVAELTARVTALEAPAPEEPSP